MIRSGPRPWWGAALAALAWAASAAAADPPALELVQKIPLHGPAGKRLDHMALDAKHDRLFVANMANGSLDVVDLKAGKLVKEIADQPGIQGVAYAADLDRVFACVGEANRCNVFDGESYRLLKSIPFDDADNVRYDARTGLVYVAHADKRLGVLDAKTLEVKEDIKLPAASEAFLLEKHRPRTYLNTPAAGQVVVLDREKREVVQTFPVKRAAANYPMALDESRHRLFVGCRKEPMVVVLDSESGKELAAVAIPGDIDDLFFDAERQRLYASCGEGFLAVIRQIDADRYELLEKLPTVKLARTCLFDAAGGRLFLLVPRLEGKEGPEVWVYRARP